MLSTMHVVATVVMIMVCLARKTRRARLQTSEGKYLLKSRRVRCRQKGCLDAIPRQRSRGTSTRNHLRQRRRKHRLRRYNSVGLLRDGRNRMWLRLRHPPNRRREGGVVTGMISPDNRGNWATQVEIIRMWHNPPQQCFHQAHPCNLRAGVGRLDVCHKRRMLNPAVPFTRNPYLRRRRMWDGL